MEFWHIVSEITILLSVAVVLGMFCEKIGLSGIVGYLLAGTLLGPGVFDLLTAGEEAIHSIAEIGVSLLLFTIGLEINRGMLKELIGKGFVLGALQIFVTGAVGFGVARYFSIDVSASLVIGAMAALSSTAVVIRMLQDRSEFDSQHGRVAFMVLLVQDLAILPLMIMVAFLGKDTGTELSSELGLAGVKFVALIVTLILFGALILPKFFGAALIKRSSEFPVLLGVVTCLSTMWLSHLLGFSPALGAFVAGLVLAGSPYAAQVRGDVAPLRYIFLALFFGVTGTLADIPWILEGSHAIQVLLLVSAIVIGKTFIVWFISSCLKKPRRISVASGLCLAQIGEFSFVLGTEAFNSNLLSDDLFQLFMSSSLITLLITPFMISRAKQIAKSIDGILGKEQATIEGGIDDTGEHHVIVIGFGVAGKRVVPDLLESGKQVVVIDMGENGINEAKKLGAMTVLGNAQRRDVLEHAGIETAQLCILTLPDHRTSEQTIHQIRACAPTVPIVARSRYSIHTKHLEAAGADEVVDEEESVGYTVLRKSLKQLGL